MSASASVEQLCSYFEREIASIIRLRHQDEYGSEGNGNVRRYRKSLLISLIDTLAGIRFHRTTYPQLAKSNRERFLRFVKEHAAWNMQHLVSMPFLNDALARGGIRDSALAGHVRKAVAGFSTDSPLSVRATLIDKSLDVLDKLATSEAEKQALVGCSHPSLLYKYRNYVVHESRTPGYAMEVTDEPEAHYNGYINNPSWHLAYPTAMFVDIATSSVASVRNYMHTNNVDPYLAVDDTTRW
jgi:hypothetical protein